MRRPRQQCECGSTWYTRTYGEDGGNVWECNNCWKQTPIKKRGEPKQTETFQGHPVTPAQLKTLDALHRAVLANDGLQSISDDYEYKRFDLTAAGYDDSYYLITEVGRKNDEGTLASAFCRTYRHIHIGVGGGCELLNAKTQSKQKRRGVRKCSYLVTK